MADLIRRLAAALLAAAALASAAGEDRFIVMASTTSTEQSGLFAHLLPAFKVASGIDVRVLALGTGQALDLARRGDADLVFVHDQPAEEKFVADGFGIKRLPVMYNDFVLVRPRDDPAAVRGHDIVAALTKLAAQGTPFISRGDNSGTHAAERRYWELAAIDIEAGKPKGYQACGCGMGPALNIEGSSNAYLIADRGSWLNFKNRADLALLVEGDMRLFNQPDSRETSAARSKRSGDGGATTRALSN